MPRYHVFLGAPEAEDISIECISSTSPKWETVETVLNPGVTYQQRRHLELEETSRRISRLYENVIFRDESEEYISDEPDCPGAVSHTTGLGVWTPMSISVGDLDN